MSNSEDLRPHAGGACSVNQRASPGTDFKPRRWMSLSSFSGPKLYVDPALFDNSRFDFFTEFCLCMSILLREWTGDGSWLHNFSLLCYLLFVARKSKFSMRCSRLTLLRVCWSSSCAFASAAALVNSLFVNLLFFCSRCEVDPPRWHSCPRVHTSRCFTFFLFEAECFWSFFLWFTARSVQRCRPPVSLDVRGHP